MGRQHGELKGRRPSPAYTRLPQTSIVGATVQFPTEGLMRLLAPAWTAPQQSSRGRQQGERNLSQSQLLYVGIIFYAERPTGTTQVGWQAGWRRISVTIEGR